MTHAKYTPGPWNVGIEDEPMDGVEGIEINAPYTKYSPSGEKNIAYAMSLNDDLKVCEENRANARLIAAAPSLLEALEECAEELQFIAEKLGFSGYGDGGDHKAGAGEGLRFGHALSRSRAAINKAKGE